MQYRERIGGCIGDRVMYYISSCKYVSSESALMRLLVLEQGINRGHQNC